MGKGVDCAGVLTETTRAVGPLPAETIDEIEREIHGYGRNPNHDGMLQRVCDKHMRRIKQAQVQDADVALIRFDVEPQHLAILADRSGVPYLIHALAAERRVVEQRLDSVWRARVVAFYSVF